MKTFFTTARITALLYLGLAVSGIFGFVLLNAQIHVAGDGAATAANLVNQETLARVGLAGQLGVVAFQVLAALWFFKLFRKVNSFAAICLAAFGMLGAVAVLVGLVFSAGALQVALDPMSARGGGGAATALLLWELYLMAWTAGNLFFGLWLIPMGYLVLAAKMPRVLGWILILGGIGYIVSGLLKLAVPAAPAGLISTLVIPATIGEFWIIGYLLLNRPSAKNLSK